MPAAPRRGYNPTCHMGEPTPPPQTPEGDAGGPHESSSTDVTSKRCPVCGELYTGDRHSKCASSGGPGKSPSSKSRIDEIPAEAKEAAADPARQLNQYILVRQVGRGGMGTVWKAWDRKLTRWAAIKFLTATEEEDILRFQREARIAARLRHPNIAPIYEVGEAAAGQQKRYYLAMEFIDGRSLADTEPPVREALEIIAKAAQGVEAAHRAGVVHRDLKPQNIMLSGDGWPYVMDFGLAKAFQADSSISAAGAVIGTPAFMPPEQAQGRLEEIDSRSDVYSLGATLYAILCRRQPFSGQSPMEVLMKVCHEEPVPPRKLNPDIPPDVETIILKAMAKEKEDRYASAGELASDIQRHLSSEEISARTPGTLKLAARKLKRNPWPALAITLMLAGACAAAFFAAGRRAPGAGGISQGPDHDRGRREREWLSAWNATRRLLDLDDWRPDDTGTAARANALLRRIADEAPGRDQDAADWLAGQLDRAEARLRAAGGPSETAKAPARRIALWCDAILAAAGGVESLERISERAARVRAAARSLADYRGRFTLRLLVGPYASVTRFSRGGTEVPLQQRHSPAELGTFDIDDYEIELTHPELGTRSFSIAAGDLKDGKTYLLCGRMREGDLRLSEAAR